MKKYRRAALALLLPCGFAAATASITAPLNPEVNWTHEVRVPIDGNGFGTARVLLMPDDLQQPASLDWHSASFSASTQATDEAASTLIAIAVDGDESFRRFDGSNFCDWLMMEHSASSHASFSFCSGSEGCKIPESSVWVAVRRDMHAEAALERDRWVSLSLSMTMPNLKKSKSQGEASTSSGPFEGASPLFPTFVASSEFKMESAFSGLRLASAPAICGDLNGSSDWAQKTAIADGHFMTDRAAVVQVASLNVTAFDASPSDVGFEEQIFTQTAASELRLLNGESLFLKVSLPAPSTVSSLLSTSGRSLRRSKESISESASPPHAFSELPADAVLNMRGAHKEQVYMAAAVSWPSLSLAHEDSLASAPTALVRYYRPVDFLAAPTAEEGAGDALKLNLTALMERAILGHPSIEGRAVSSHCEFWVLVTPVSTFIDWMVTPTVTLESRRGYKLSVPFQPQDTEAPAKSMAKYLMDVVVFCVLVLAFSILGLAAILLFRYVRNPAAYEYYASQVPSATYQHLRSIGQRIRGWRRQGSSEDSDKEPHLELSEHLNSPHDEEVRAAASEFKLEGFDDASIHRERIAYTGIPAPVDSNQTVASSPADSLVDAAACVGEEARISKKVTFEEAGASEASAVIPPRLPPPPNDTRRGADSSISVESPIGSPYAMTYSPPPQPKRLTDSEKQHHISDFSS